MTWDQWVILFFGPTALGLAFTERYRQWGPVSGMIGQVAWWVTLVEHAQWGAVLASVAYQAAWIYGLWNFRKEYVCLFKNLTDRATSWWTSAGLTTKSYPWSLRLSQAISEQKRPAHRNSSCGFVKSIWLEIVLTAQRFRHGF